MALSSVGYLVGRVRGKPGRLFSVPAALTLVLGSPAANALTKEQAIEGCRQTVGKPYVQSCMRAGGEMGSCRAKAYSTVRDCTISALNRANGRANVAVSIEEHGATKKDSIKLGNALPAGFVAPPRTIADVTAILDREKPDAAALAKLKADAEANPNNLSGSELAVFYFYRGNTRSLLGRSEDAIADGEKTLALARAAGDEMLYQVPIPSVLPIFTTPVPLGNKGCCVSPRSRQLS